MFIVIALAWLLALGAVAFETYVTVHVGGVVPAACLVISIGALSTITYIATREWMSR